MLQIPNRDIIVPLYEGNKATVQVIVDAPNSASIHRYYAEQVIADCALSTSEYAKGKWNVLRFRPDDIAFVVREKETIQYNCLYVAHVFVVSSHYMWDGRALYSACRPNRLSARKFKMAK